MTIPAADDFLALLSSKFGQKSFFNPTQFALWLGLDPSAVAGGQGYVVVRPIDGVSNDWPSLASTLAANAYKNAVVLLPGPNGEQFQCKTPLPAYVPSGSVIVGSPGTTVVCSLGTGVGIGNGPFSMLPVFGATIAVTANNTPGSNVITVDTSPAGGVGSYIELQLTAAHLSGSTYQIAAITPAGADFDLTLDRAVIFTVLAATDQIKEVVPVQDVRIYGNGMQIVGTADVYVEVQGALRTVVEDLRLDGSTAAGAAVAGIIFDTYSFQCEARRIIGIGDGGAVGATGMWTIGDTNVYRDCQMAGWTTGYVAADTVQCSVEGCDAYGCAIGFSITADGGATFTPSFASRFISCVAYGCTSNGFQLDQGAHDITLDGCVSVFNGGHGCALLATHGNCLNNRFVGCTFNNNAQSGFQDIAGAQGTVLDGCDLSGNAQKGIDVLSVGLRMLGCVSSTAGGGTTVVVETGADLSMQACDFAYDVNAGTCVQVLGTGILRSDDLRIVNTGVNARAIANDGNTSRSYLSKTRVTCSAATSAHQSSGNACVVAIEDFETDGAGLGGSVGLNQAAGCTYRLSGRIDVDGCVVPYNVAAGTFWSRSVQGAAVTIVTIGGGGAPVVVAWPDLKSSDVVVLTRIVDPAAPQPQPSVQQVAGTGFTVTPIGVADAGAQYMYTIQ